MFAGQYVRGAWEWSIDLGGRVAATVRRHAASRILPLTALTLIVIDTFIKPVSWTSVALLAIVFAPRVLQVLQMIKTLELPGGLKLEMRVLEADAERAGLLKTPKEGTEAAVMLNNREHTLAILRYELTVRLNRLLEASSSEKTGPMSLGQSIRHLRSMKLLSPEQFEVLQRIVPLLNSVSHASPVDDEAASWAQEVGPRLIAGLDELIETIRSTRKWLDPSPDAP